MSRHIRIETQTVFSVVDESGAVLSGPSTNFAHIQWVAEQGKDEQGPMEYPAFTINTLQAHVLATFRGGEVGEDNDGQVVIYTGLKFAGDEAETLVPMD